MLTTQNIKNGLVGASLALSSIGLFSGESLANENFVSHDEAAITEKYDMVDDAPLNTSANVMKFSGALENCKTPTYDGPISWGDQRINHRDQNIFMGSLCFGVPLALVGLAIGSSIVEHHKSQLLKNTAGLSCAGIAFLMALVVTDYVDKVDYYNSPRLIEFHTTIEEANSLGGPHDERHGKYTSGPYYGQIVHIPETTLPLAANQQNSPLVAGEKIVASVYTDKDGNILSWTACPDKR